MTDDIFTSDQSGNTDDQGNPLETLVGEGKKFKTTEDLAKAKVESDKFIEQLKTEQAGLRDELAKKEAEASQGATLKEIMDALEEQKPNSGSDGGDGNQPTLNPEELQKLIDARLVQREDEITRTSNRTQANQQLVTKFDGDAQKAKAHVAVKAAELGLTPEELGKMSETSPKAFATLVGVEQSSSSAKSGGSANALSDTNTDTMLNVSQGDRNIEFYQKLRKTSPKDFWSPSVQQEIYKLGATEGVESVQKILSN